MPHGLIVASMLRASRESTALKIDQPSCKDCGEGRKIVHLPSKNLEHEGISVVEWRCKPQAEDSITLRCIGSYPKLVSTSLRISEGPYLC